MSLIEELGELSLVCAGLKAENEELRELLSDAHDLLSGLHAEMDSFYASPQMPRAPILSIIQAWLVRAQPMLNKDEKRSGILRKSEETPQ